MNIIKLLRSSKKWNKLKERMRSIESIKSLPRFEQGTTNILEKSFIYVDSASFVFMYEEIFRQEIYKFDTQKIIL